MFTYCFNNEFICIFISLLGILYFYDNERCKIKFPVRDNKVLLYCIVPTFDCDNDGTEDTPPGIVDGTGVLSTVSRRGRGDTQGTLVPIPPFYQSLAGLQGLAVLGPSDRGWRRACTDNVVTRHRQSL